MAKPNAIRFKCPDCTSSMLADAIWMDKGQNFFIQAACGQCQKIFDYSVDMLMASILDETFVPGPRRIQ